MKRFFSLLTLIVLLTLSTTLFPPASAFAAACPSGNDPKGQVLQGIGESGSNCDSSGVPSTIQVIVNILSFIRGAVAVIMIVISGIKFITAGGDSQAVSSARNTLIYAIIGLVIIAMAQVIVHFVLQAVFHGTVSGS